MLFYFAFYFCMTIAAIAFVYCVVEYRRLHMQ